MNYSKIKKLIVIILLVTVMMLAAGCMEILDLLDGDGGFYSYQEGELAVHFIDVGQGDSILIQLPEGEVMLIDAGPDSSGVPVISYLKEQGIERIDYLVATHPHADHIAGMKSVIQEFEIGKVFMPKVTHTTKTFENMLLAIKEKGLKITTARAGVTVMEADDLQLIFAAPCGTSYDSLNDYSAVVRIRYGNTACIFTGDAEAFSEEEMLDSGMELQADLLKVSHHGSSSSTIQEFLEAVSPEYAVISVGDENQYGHPHRETLDKLEEAGIAVYRTDQDGTVVFVSDSENIKRF